MSGDPQFERLVIGGLLQQPGVLADCDLSAGMFASETYRQAFEVIAAIGRDAVDVFDIAEKLKRSTGQENWLDILTAAIQQCYAPGNTKLYADKLRTAYRSREAKAIAATLAQDGSLEAIDTAIKALLELGMEQRNYDIGIREALTQAVDHIDQVFNLDGALAGITSGLTDLDQILGGFHDGDLTVIAARPAMGKTALLLNFALAANVSCGIISSEQPASQCATRMIAMQGRLNANKLRNASQLADGDWPEITRATSQLMERGVRFNEKSGISIAELVRQARAWKHRHGIEILYVDYIQRVKATDSRLPRHEQVGEVVMALKELARDLSIPVVALAQVNRNVENRSNKRPGMGDIKDSGTIEQEADTIMALYRDEVYNKDSDDRGTAELDVLKNRHGPTGFLRVVWLAHCMQFENFTGSRDMWSGPPDAA